MDTGYLCCVGGTERFQDKRNYFEKELRKLSSVADERHRPDIRITVSRFNLLESVSVNDTGLIILTQLMSSAWLPYTLTHNHIFKI